MMEPFVQHVERGLARFLLFDEGPRLGACDSVLSGAIYISVFPCFNVEHWAKMFLVLVICGGYDSKTVVESQWYVCCVRGEKMIKMWNIF